MSYREPAAIPSQHVKLKTYNATKMFGALMIVTIALISVFGFTAIALSSGVVMLLTPIAAAAGMVGVWFKLQDHRFTLEFTAHRVLLRALNGDVLGDTSKGTLKLTRVRYTHRTGARGYEHPGWQMAYAHNQLLIGTRSVEPVWHDVTYNPRHPDFELSARDFSTLKQHA